MPRTRWGKATCELKNPCSREAVKSQDSGSSDVAPRDRPMTSDWSVTERVRLDATTPQ
jgi:hypothetical protein